MALRNKANKGLTYSSQVSSAKPLYSGKTFIEAPTAGNSATCKSCAHCPWMAMNGLRNLAEVLESGANQIHVEPSIGLQAKRAIDRMLDFAAAKRAKAIVQAVTHYKDPKILMEVSIGLGEAMVGINCGEMRDAEKLATRGW